MFTLLHPTESYVSFTAIDGSKHEIWPESEEQFYEGNLLPNGNAIYLSMSYIHYNETLELCYPAQNVELYLTLNVTKMFRKLLKFLSISLLFSLSLHP